MGIYSLRLGFYCLAQLELWCQDIWVLQNTAPSDILTLAAQMDGEIP